MRFTQIILGTLAAPFPKRQEMKETSAERRINSSSKWLQQWRRPWSPDCFMQSAKELIFDQSRSKGISRKRVKKINWIFRILRQGSEVSQKFSPFKKMHLTITVLCSPIVVTSTQKTRNRADRRSRRTITNAFFYQTVADFPWKNTWIFLLVIFDTVLDLWSCDSRLRAANYTGTNASRFLDDREHKISFSINQSSISLFSPDNGSISSKHIRARLEDCVKFDMVAHQTQQAQLFSIESQTAMVDRWWTHRRVDWLVLVPLTCHLGIKILNLN